MYFRSAPPLLKLPLFKLPLFVKVVCVSSVFQLNLQGGHMYFRSAPPLLKLPCL